MSHEHAEHAAWARLTDTRRGKPQTLAVLPKVTRAYWDARITSPSGPPYSEQRGDPDALTRRRAAARAEAKAALEAQRVGLDRIDSFGESSGADMQAEDLAWVDAAGVAHALPTVEVGTPDAMRAPEVGRKRQRPRNKHGRIDWSAEGVGLGLRPPSEIAEAMGVTRSRVIEVHRRCEIMPAPESEAYLASQRALRSARAVAAAAKQTEEMRKARIGNTAKIAWAEQPMGVEMVSDMAARLGVHTDSVIRAHKRMGITPITPRRAAALANAATRKAKAREREAKKAQAAADAEAKRMMAAKMEMQRARERAQPKAKILEAR